MQALIIIAGILIASTSVNGLGFGGGASSCGCAPPAPPPPPPCLPPPPPAAYVCPAAPPPPPPCPPPPPPPAPCAAPVACPPPPPPPPSCSCQAPVQSCAPPPPPASNDCCHKCGNPCKFRTRKALAAVIAPQQNTSAVCNSEKLRAIMEENMTDNTSDSKRAIQKKAQEKLKGRFDVICASGDFSYLSNTNLFCQVSQNDVTCYASRQL
uniref:Ground-like domain-containing protein n=1 Tax=Plectus sambesii TaxID=2011161 RepID=A0A914XNH7_9BILA